MATLTAGEKARMYALGKIMRGGASRGGYVSGAVFLTIDGTPQQGTVLLDSLTITDELDETPNTCGFRVNGWKPTPGSEVIVTLGSKNAATRLYAGFALTVTQLYVGDRPANVQSDIRCVDYTWQFGFLTVTKQYRTQSASAIAADLIATYAAANGFTSRAVPNLPVLDEITYTNEPLDAALTRLARRIGGYWFVDYQKGVHLFLDAEDPSQAPEVLTPQHKSLRAFQMSADRTQVLTRVYVEGRGSNVLATVGPGETRIPLAAVDMFAVGPTVFAKVSPQGSSGGAQFLTFTGVVDGGDGALVGSGTTPSAPPAVALSSGGAVPAGDHYYVYTWVSAVGETLNAPGVFLTISGSAPYATAPTVTVAEGSGLPLGVYIYGVSHVLASGETAVTSAGLTTCAGWTAASDPLNTTSGLRTVTGQSNLGSVGDRLVCRQCWRQTTALSPATLGATSAQLTLVQGTGAPGTPCAVLADVNYGTPVGSTAHYVDIQIQNVTKGGPWQTVLTYPSAQYPYPTSITLTTVNFSTAATETPGGLPKASVTVTVNAAGADVTARRVYRTKQGGGPLYFLRQVSGSTLTSFTDTTADSALVTPPPAGAGALQTVNLSGIATGPHTGSGGGTTARKVYRWDNNVWYLVTTIANNTATTYVDTAATASLTPAAWPATDTSGLVADGGQVLAGVATIPVSGTGPFPATGGWVLSGNNRIRYAGVAGATLTGVPTSGDGFIENTIPYGTPITLAPMLTGVAGITAPIVAGDELYLVVQRDDPARQADVADMVNGGPGIREEWVQDWRLSITEAQARAQATLALRPLEDVTVSYVCRDTRTAAGKTISVQLPAPTNVWGTFKIQSVTINNFRPHPNQMPTYTVTASSQRFNFEDWLRRMDTSV